VSVEERRNGGAAWRTSRRRLIAAAGAGGAVLAAACSTGSKRAPASASGSPGQAASPRRGGVANYAGGTAGSQDILMRPYDPTLQSQGGAKSYALFYERLLGYNLSTYAIEPELAQKWEQPSPTEYLFHLQPGVKWQSKAPVNGRALTTDDVLFSLQRAQRSDPKNLARSLTTGFDKIEAPDPSSVRITTKSPDASMLKIMATEQLSIVAQEVLTKFPIPQTADAVVGTGPFMMTSVEANVGAEYSRNPDYWQSGAPYLDGFRSRFFPDAQTAYAAFSAGQIDIALLSGPDVKSYIAKQGPGFSPAWGADDTLNSMLCPNVKNKPMDDARVPRALRLLIDHDEFISAWAETVFGRGIHGSIFPVALGDYDLTQDEYKQQLEWKQPKDPAIKEGLSLLSAAGYDKQTPLKFSLIAANGGGQEYLVATQLLQAQWKRLSQGVVDVDIKFLDQAPYDNTRANRSFACGLFGMSAGPVDAGLWLSTTYHSGGSSNFMDFSDPQVDGMIDKQRGIFDETQRKAAVKEIVRYMIDHGPTTVGANPYFFHAVQPKLHGYQPETHYMNGKTYKSVWIGG